jgi:hypothetical protein
MPDAGGRGAGQAGGGAGGGDGEHNQLWKLSAAGLGGVGHGRTGGKKTGESIKNQTGAEQRVAPGRSDRPTEVLQNSFCSLQLNQEKQNIESVHIT